MTSFVYFVSLVLLFLNAISNPALSHQDILDEPFGIDVSEDGEVQKRILTESEYDCNETPPNTSYVTVNYKVAKTDDLIVFEEEDGFEFQIGIGNVICCWDLALASMNKGEISIIRCPSEYAYGNTSESESGLLPGTSLDFEVEVVEWTKPKKPKPTPNTSGRRTCGEIFSYASSPSSSSSSSYRINNKHKYKNGKSEYHDKQIDENDHDNSKYFVESTSSSKKLWSGKSNQMVEIKQVNHKMEGIKTASILKQDADDESKYNRYSFYVLLTLVTMNTIFGIFCFFKSKIISWCHKYRNHLVTGYYTASSAIDVEINPNMIQVISSDSVINDFSVYECSDNDESYIE